ncbi:hypothetical protein [Burkholderia ubonensis]|uniref:hypothetical protein n=1 Tax=Burkholderia ubonensis TaxID=101571 RepID=UPI0018E1785C|nr:hypothetical protein [Burkholderia ubonensis]
MIDAFKLAHVHPRCGATTRAISAETHNRMAAGILIRYPNHVRNSSEYCAATNANPTSRRAPARLPQLADHLIFANNGRTSTTGRLRSWTTLPKPSAPSL